MKYGKAVQERFFIKDREAQVVNSVLGLSGEAGEVADLFKKFMFHPHSKLKDEHKMKVELRKELGDILWYLSALNELMFGDSLLDLAKDNIKKLTERYPDLYGTIKCADLTL